MDIRVKLALGAFKAALRLADVSGIGDVDSGPPGTTTGTHPLKRNEP
jgi:hypothetical protein